MLGLAIGLGVHQSPNLQGGAPPQYNPEAGLGTALLVSPGSLVTSTSILRDSPAVLAADFVGLNGSGGGMIAEFGGRVNGAYCGFRTNGDFMVRCGDGTVANPPFSANKTGYVLNTQGIVSGNGTLVVEVVPGTPITARAWWNGQELTGAVAGSAGYDTWCGTDEGGYLFFAGSSSPEGEITSLVTYTSASDLRYYPNKVVAP